MNEYWQLSIRLAEMTTPTARNTLIPFPLSPVPLRLPTFVMILFAIKELSPVTVERQIMTALFKLSSTALPVNVV